MMEWIILLQETVAKKIELANMGWVDIVVILASAWALIAGYRGGFIKESSKFLSVLGGLYLTFHYFESLAGWIKRNSFIPADVTIPISYVLLLIVSVLVVFAVLQFLGRLFEVRVFMLLERIGGMALGLARYILILGLITHFLFFFPFPFIDSAFKTQSVSGPYLISVCPKTYRGLSRFIALPKWRLEPQITIK